MERGAALGRGQGTVVSQRKTFYAGSKTTLPVPASRGIVPGPPARHCHCLTCCCSRILRCPWAFLSYRQRRFSILAGQILGRSVTTLLGGLLHEELAMRWGQLLLDDAFTGGALAWLPGRTPHVGQLVYPSGGALDRLCILDLGTPRPFPVVEEGLVWFCFRNPNDQSSHAYP